MPTDTRSPAVVFRDLGDLYVEVHGQPRTAGGGRPTAVLSALLVHANHRVSLDALGDAAWPDGSRRATSTLESHLWRLRQVLEPERAPGQASTLLRTEPGGYRLVVGNDQVDSLRFAELSHRAEAQLDAGRAGEAAELCRRARELWRGQPFAAVAAQPWAAPAVARLEELHSQLLERHIEALLALGRPDSALVELETALAARPLRERLWVQRMVASYRAGRVDDALAAFTRARALLLDELGTEPGEELRATHRRVLAADPALDGPRPTPAAAVRDLPHLPRWATRLVGRDPEVARLCELVDASPLVTVQGAAGVGKTRLAVEVARRLAPSYPDGVGFVDLAGARDGDQVVDAVASALALAASPSSSPLAAVTTFLATRRMLLVLDDCEHVVEEAASLADAIGRAAPSVRLLVTSREPLEIGTESVLALTPLDVPGPDRPEGAALELFLDRRATDGHRLGPDDLDEACRVCRALEGIPLALELAAARARSFTLAEVADQSEQDPSALAGLGRRRRGARSSLFAAVERSYRLLDEDEQRLHRALSVLPGPFTVAAAAAVLGVGTGTVADLLADLTHRSLLVARGPRSPGRPSTFAQLTIVRSHAARALTEAGEGDTVSDRRDAWLLGRVTEGRPRLGTAEESAWSVALEDDLPALRAVLHRTLVDRPSSSGTSLIASLGTMFWYQRDATVEGRRWIELAADVARSRPDAVASPVAVHLAIALATVRAFARRVDLAAPVADEILAEVENDLDATRDLLTGDALVVLSTCLGLAGDPDRARRALDVVATIAGRTGDPTLELVRRARAAMSAVGRREPDVVLAEAASVHAEAEAGGNHFAEWIAAGAAQLAATVAGDGHLALRWSDACLVAIDRMSRRHAPFLLEQRANTLALLERHEEARRLYDAARVHVDRAGLPWPSLPGTAELLARTVAATGGDADGRRAGDGGRRGEPP